MSSWYFQLCRGPVARVGQKSLARFSNARKARLSSAEHLNTKVNLITGQSNTAPLHPPPTSCHRHLTAPAPFCIRIKCMHNAVSDTVHSRSPTIPPPCHHKCPTSPACNPDQAAKATLYLHSIGHIIGWQHIHAPYYLPSFRLQSYKRRPKFAIMESQQSKPDEC